MKGRSILRFVAIITLAIVLVLSSSSSSAQNQALNLTGTTELVSVSPSGERGNNYSEMPSISGDGRYVAFGSYATNLVAGDTNVDRDIFVHDRQTEEIERVSVSSSGEQGNSESLLSSISADGRYVAFESRASNLVASDSNGFVDIFVHDRQTGEIKRVSVSSSGDQGNSESTLPFISADGRYVAFASVASNLVASDTNGFMDIFVHDSQTGETECVSMSSSSEQGNDHSWWHSISADGRYVTFGSWASNLVDGDTNGYMDIFVHDRQTEETERVSVSSSGEQGNNYSETPSISGDGRYVAFESRASNLVAGDTNWRDDVFMHDQQTGETVRVSVSSSGEQGNSYSEMPSISGDGRYVAFSSYATNLVAGDTNVDRDIFVHDRQTEEIERVSVSSSGEQGNGDSWSSSISADGRYVAFVSSASNLISGDTNGFRDVFVHDRGGGGIYSISGQVTHPFGSPFEGVLVTAGLYSDFTDSRGNFIISNVFTGTYAIIPSRQDYDFYPPYRTVSVPPDKSGLYFKAILRPKLKLLVVPLNWQGSQELLDTEAETQVGLFIDEVPLNNCRDEVVLETLDVETQNFANFTCSGDNGGPNGIKAFVRDSLDIDPAGYDVVIGLAEASPCPPTAGQSNGADTIWATTESDIVTAHELGHIFGLTDEYCSRRAGSGDDRCNDGDIQGDGALTGDKNWLDASQPCDCPSDGTNDSTGSPCCNPTFTCSKLLGCYWKDMLVAHFGEKYQIRCDDTDYVEHGIIHVNYDVCCLGNKISSDNGRSIMSFAGASDVQRFDMHDLAHLTSLPELNCEPPQNLTRSSVINSAPDRNQEIIDVNLLLHPDDTVTKDNISIQDGLPTAQSILAGMSGDYEIMVLDNLGNSAWSQKFAKYFDYMGPVFFGVDYSSISYDSVDVSFRIPFACGMDILELYHNGVLIFSKILPPGCMIYIPIVSRN